VKELIPTPTFSTLRKEVDRFLERMREGDALELLSSADWIPNVDFAEKPEAYVVKAEIPGIDPKDIEVVYENGLLTIRGQKVKSESEEKGARFYRSERSYGAFTRNLRIPTAIDDKLITATFKHGLLTIVLPKTAETRGQAIPIKIS
jgi:HSP20 family protein